MQETFAFYVTACWAVKTEEACRSLDVDSKELAIHHGCLGHSDVLLCRQLAVAGDESA